MFTQKGKRLFFHFFLGILWMSCLILLAIDYQVFLSVFLVVLYPIKYVLSFTLIRSFSLYLASCYSPISSLHSLFFSFCFRLLPKFVVSWIIERCSLLMVYNIKASGCEDRMLEADFSSEVLLGVHRLQSGEREYAMVVRCSRGLSAACAEERLPALLQTCSFHSYGSEVQ